MVGGEWRWCRVIESPSADALHSEHTLRVEMDAGTATTTRIDLHALNHAIALLEPEEYEAEMQRLRVQLTDKHSSIHYHLWQPQVHSHKQLLH